MDPEKRALLEHALKNITNSKLENPQILSNQFCDQLLNTLSECPKWFVVQTSKEHGRVPLAVLCCICNLFMPYERMSAHRQLHIEALFGRAAARTSDRLDAAEAGWRLGMDIHDVLQNILESRS